MPTRSRPCARRSWRSWSARCCCTTTARRLAKDPLDSPALQALQAAIDAAADQRGAQSSRFAIWTCELRREYFRQRAFTGVGAGLLLVAGGRVSGGGEDGRHAAPADAVAEPRRSVPQDREAAWTRDRPLGGGGVCLAMVGVAIALSVSVHLADCGRSPGDGRERGAAARRRHRCFSAALDA